MDYDLVILTEDDGIRIFHPIGRPSLDNSNEIKHVIINLLKASFHHIKLHQQDDGDLMLFLDMRYSELNSAVNRVLELCMYKEEIRKSYIWNDLIKDDAIPRKIVNCDWCNKLTETYHVFQSLEVCQECYIHFPRCNSCYAVIGHNLNQSAVIGNKRYCIDCYVKRQKCNYCNEPLNILYFKDNRSKRTLCFKCRTHQLIAEEEVFRALPIVLNVIHDIYNLSAECFYDFELCDTNKLNKLYYSKGLNRYLTPNVLGLFDGKSVYLANNLSLQQCIEVLSHEYFHYLQRKYLPGWSDLYILEGFAVWGESLVQRYLNDTESLKKKDRFVLQETEYTAGFKLFRGLENKYGVQGVWDWMKTINPTPFEQLLKSEGIVI